MTRVMAQVGMVMNLDKCIGCHTCSVTCKQTWTNRRGVEYVWFNNVETRPGLGYPRRYEDQEEWKGGWERTKRGRLRLRSGSRFRRLASIFSNPKLPGLDDYYEPWTYDYDTLISAPPMDTVPVARPKSMITGKDMEIRWGANWDDDLGGTAETGHADPMLKGIEDQVSFEFEKAFMFYLPRICEHCLNPSCVASCPSGAMYKRTEDGIVLVDQDRCRGWRMCVSGCPYKKVYFNHRTGKAEKCTLCYPRIEVGQPTVCAETCVGRLRYIGLFLYDADKVLAAASVESDQDLYEAQLDLLLDPSDPAVVEQARRDGIAEDWIEAAQRSPVYRLAKQYRLALPLHPEYRTMPMVWYIPPLSPVVDALRRQRQRRGGQGQPLRGHRDAAHPDRLSRQPHDGGRRLGGRRRAAAARGHALLHARREPRPRHRRVDPRVGGPHRRGHLRDVPPARHRQVRAALRHPRGAPGGRGRARGDRGLLAGLLRWTRDGDHRGRRGSPRAGVDRELPPHQAARRGRGPRVAARVGRRPMRTGRHVDETGVRRLLAVCSMLLAYPDEATVERLPVVLANLERLPESSRRPVSELVEWLAGVELLQAQAHYVENFDRRRRACLYLTYFLNGDTRRRGMALVEFKQAYQAAGFDLGPEELPDFLPVVLEFGAVGDLDVALELLARHRSGLEVLEHALEGFHSPFAAAATALLTVVPATSEGPTAEQLAASGPPAEQVGLTPFIPLESLTVGARA